MEEIIPKVSIVMTYFERHDQLITTLKSFTQLGYGNDVEVIIVDDGSIENPAVEPDFPCNFTIRIIYLDPKLKWYVNPCIPFNHGIRNAIGDIVLLQNAECFHLHNVVDYAKKNLDSNTYLTFSCYSLPEEDSKKLYKDFDLLAFQDHLTFLNKAPLHDGEAGWYNHSEFRPVAYHFCAAITRKKLLELGGFDERYALGIGFDDDQLLFSIDKARLKIRIVDSISVVHQWHYTIKNNQNSLRNKLILRNKFLFYFVTKRGMSYGLFKILFGMGSCINNVGLIFKFIKFIYKMKRGLHRRTSNTLKNINKKLILPIIKLLYGKPGKDIPIILNNRNRFVMLKGMVEWLQKIGFSNIVILDNESTYPPLLDYYKQLEANDNVRVIYLGANVGAYSIWQIKALRKFTRSYYIYSDSDLFPLNGCPVDFLDHFYRALKQYPKIQKVGFGLQIKDIPDYFDKKKTVVLTESLYWREMTEDNNFFIAPIDTTFALYAPYQKGGPELASLRSNYPYILKHLPWYVNLNELDEEEQYYRDQANSFSSSNIHFTLR